MKKLFLSTLLCFVVFSTFAIKSSELKYYDATKFPVIGTLAPDASKSYSRLPDSLENRIRKEVWDLGQNSAGIAVRFRSDASAIGADWVAVKKFNMNHMTAAGIRGLDLYVRTEDGAWTTLGSARPVFGKKHTQTLIMSDMTPKMREYMLYLSLYDGVDSLMIGVDSAAVILPPAIDSPRRERPVIMYGSSILQGGCASRPGMVHTSILERMLDREVINLGFSGNAKLDPEIAELIAAYPNPGLVVIDAMPNCKTLEVKERMMPFYQIIRKTHPEVPIIIVESPIFPVMRFNNETLATISEKNEALEDIYNNIVASGDKNVYYFRGEDVLGDCVEGTVDNYHFTDLGFTHYANALFPLMARLMAQ